jgi:hypothetical protein
VEFVGVDSDIDLTSDEEQEFSSWRWCSATEVKRRAATFRRAGYLAPLREFLAFKRSKKAGEPKKKSNRRKGTRA